MHPHWTGVSKVQWGFSAFEVLMEKEVNTYHVSSEIRQLRPCMDFPGGSDGKASAYIAGDLGSISGLGRSPREGNGNPLQYS